MEGCTCTIDYSTVVWEGICAIWTIHLVQQYGTVYFQYGLQYSSVEGYTLKKIWPTTAVWKGILAIWPTTAVWKGILAI